MIDSVTNRSLLLYPARTMCQIIHVTDYVGHIKISVSWSTQVFMVVRDDITIIIFMENFVVMTTLLALGLSIVQREQAAALLVVMGRPVAVKFVALLPGSRGMRAFGIILFVASGAIDSDAARAWTTRKMLANPRDAGERQNTAQARDDKPEREGRDWILAPRYTPDWCQMSWATLVLPEIMVRSLNGDITCLLIAFGRDAYIEFTVETNSGRIRDTMRTANDGVTGLNSCPGKSHAAIIPPDRGGPAGFTGAMGLGQLHKRKLTLAYRNRV